MNGFSLDTTSRIVKRFNQPNAVWCDFIYQPSDITSPGAPIPTTSFSFRNLIGVPERAYSGKEMLQLVKFDITSQNTKLDVQQGKMSEYKIRVVYTPHVERAVIHAVDDE